MEKDVIVNNTTYDGVAKVVLTDADDGGHASFDETSGATANDNDVTIGETYYANGEMRTGTHECDENSSDDPNNSNGNIYWDNIIDRPFYDIKSFDDIYWNGTIDGNVQTTLTIGDNIITLYKIDDLIIDIDKMVGSIYKYGFSTDIQEKTISEDDITFRHSSGTFFISDHIMVISDDNILIDGEINGSEISALFPESGIYSYYVINNNDTSHVRSIIPSKEVGKTLDDKYLNDNIVRNEDLKQSDYLQNDETSIDHIKNRPFYDGPIFEDIIWNGIRNNQEPVTIELSDMILVYYKVSEQYIPKDKIIDSRVIVNETYNTIVEDDIILENTNGSYFANIYLAVISQNNDILSGIFRDTEINVIFPTKGIYFVNTIVGNSQIKTTTLKTYKNEVKKYLESKYIQDDIMRTSEKGKSGGVATLGQDGKLNIEQLSVDTRAYFTNYSDAESAALEAKQIGTPNAIYYYGQELTVIENNIAKKYIIQPDNTLVEIGHGNGDNVTDTVDEVYVGIEEPIDPKCVVWFDTTTATPLVKYKSETGEWVVVAGGGSSIKEYIASVTDDGGEASVDINITGEEHEKTLEFNFKNIEGKSGVYVGGGEMPEGYNVQIDPDGSPTEIVNGVTFFPEIDDDGNLTWTNNGGLDNPTPKNIKGPQGQSAYDVAVSKGFKGSQEDWLKTLIGDIVDITNIEATIDSNTGIPEVLVDISGTETEKSIKFTFKNIKGDKGDKGDIGNKGDKGDVGNTPNITMGEVKTLSPGSKVDANFTGDKENPVLNLSVPRGYDGYTPMRGIDYYTDDDVNELLNLISMRFLSGYKIEPVDNIPEVQDPNTIYIIMAKSHN